MMLNNFYTATLYTIFAGVETAVSECASPEDIV